MRFRFLDSKQKRNTSRRKHLDSDHFMNAQKKNEMFIPSKILMILEVLVSWMVPSIRNVDVGNLFELDVLLLFELPNMAED